ncbi:MAG: hypothetical protein EPO57_03945 [Chitinophagaceae bacterium]|nr:MAG: hypothetical protein EPO57_03945 [Chitinophagaceae bacterium]
MKKITVFAIGLCVSIQLSSQVSSELLRRGVRDSIGLPLNMNAIYNRPFLKLNKLPLAIGGYAEANYQYAKENGIGEGHQFQMRRMTLFFSTAIANRFSYLSEIEFEEGTKEINIEFAALDVEFTSLLNLRTGIIMNPIAAFNQNHDGPKWEFVDRPIAATQLLPATFSNVGMGLYGKGNQNDWSYGYEFYLTNGWNDKIIANDENKTFLPAVKENKDRFEESFNGSLLATSKVSLANSKFGEFGLSWMGGVYNKFQDDGFVLDKKRRADVFAIDFNTKISKLQTSIVAEWAWVIVDVPATYTEQFGKKQVGGFVDVVQPIYKGKIFGFENSILNAAMRVEYVDWNKGKFNSTNENISEDIFSITPAISWRPTAETVFRLNYRYQWKTDLLGNPPSKQGAIQIGVSTYF